jgi:hypothetical protein
MSVLLTDEAVRAARSGYTHPESEKGISRECGLRDGINYHATEGREALVEAVMSKLPTHGPAGFGRWSDKHRREQAEAVVTALVGEKS